MKIKKIASMMFEMDSTNEILNIYSYSTCICSIRLNERKYPKISFDCEHYSRTTTIHQGIALAIAIKCCEDMVIVTSVYRISKAKTLYDLHQSFACEPCTNLK